MLTIQYGLVNSAMGQIPCSTERISCLYVSMFDFSSLPVPQAMCNELPVTTVIVIYGLFAAAASSELSASVKADLRFRPPGNRGSSAVLHRRYGEQ